MKYRCLCCDNYTLPCPANDAVAFICPICFWQNDVFSLRKDEASDENHGLTLLEARDNYRRYGACCPKMLRYTREATEYERTGGN